MMTEERGAAGAVLLWSALFLAIHLSVPRDGVADTEAITPAPKPMDIVLVLDNSGSMRKNDPRFLTKQAAKTFLRNGLEDVWVGILIFDKSAELSVPLTPLSDQTRDAMTRRLDRLDHRGRFTNTSAAMERAIYEVKTNGRKEASKSIIVLTDGVIDTGNKTRDLENTRWLREEFVADAALNHVPVYVIALGEEADFQLLHDLAQKTLGAYFRVDRPEDISPVFERIHTAIVQRAAPVEAVAPEPKPAAIVEAPTDANAAALSEPVETQRAISPPSPSPPGAPATSAPAAEEQPASSPPASDMDAIKDPRYRVLIAVGASLTLVLILAMRRRARSSPARQAGSSPPPGKEVIPEAFLYDLSGATGREYHRLTKKLTLVGRIAADPEEDVDQLVIERSTIGRQHALIEYKHHGYWLTDRRSRNGTFLNGRRVTGEVCLKHGDTLRFHDVEFKIAMAGLGATDETLAAGIPTWALAGDKAVAAAAEPVASLAGNPQAGIDYLPEDNTNFQAPSPEVHSDDPTLPTQRTIKRSLKDYFEG